MGQYDPKTPSAFNFVNVVFTLVLGSVIYVGVWYLPHLWSVWQLVGIMQGVGNDAYRNFDDDDLLKKLVKDSARTGLRLRKENFQIEREPYGPEEMTALLKDLSKNRSSAHAMHQKRGKALHVTVDLTIQAKWPFLDKVTPLHFTRSTSTDLSIIKY